MKLSLKHINVDLPDGLRLVCRPLESWAYQEWLAKSLSVGAADITDDMAPDVRARLIKDLSVKLISDSSAIELALKILEAHVVRIEGAELDSENGPIAATMANLKDVGGLLPYFLRAVTALHGQSTLKEQEAKD